MKLLYTTAALLGLSSLGAAAAAMDPIWPSSIDELEDLMFLNAGYRASGFSAAVTPCSYSAAGLGRITAAEWIRTAFHDMATASIYFGGSGGLDASIMFEVDRDENVGAAFNSSLAFFANYYSTRASVSDLIALSVYTAVRSCGGPIVPIRAGRIDAIAAGDIGVPVPENSAYTFEQQFLRTGFNTSDMIAMTACGHTVGGVHAADFPQIVTPGSAPPNDYVAVDSTIDVFDNRVAVEWVAGTMADPMSVGPSVASGRNSDAKVFGADGNVTMMALTDPAVFASTCSSVLQRMIEVVPPGVVLNTDAIQPYEVKPTELQLTLLSGGASLSFTGLIRVRTTSRSLASVQLVYKDRMGGSTCGSCIISTTAIGTTTGFDDSFAFYSFSATISSALSISSFNVELDITGGSSELHNNGGAGYLVQDSIMFQSPQSCVDGAGQLTVVAAVRNTVSSPVSLNLSIMVPRQGVIVPALTNSSLAMTKGAAAGPYNLYSVSPTLNSNQIVTTRFGVSSGTAADTFKSTSNLGAKCKSLGGSSSSSSSSSTTKKTTSKSSVKSTSTKKSISTTKSASTTKSSSTKKSTSTTKSISTTKSTSTGKSTTSKSTASRSTSTTKSTSTIKNISTTKSTSTTKSISSSSTLHTTTRHSSTSTSSTSPTLTQTSPANKATVGNYTYLACYTEGTNSRALSASSTALDTMTLEVCSNFCSGSLYFGTEYGRECYCGDSFSSGSILAAAADCDMPCAADSLEFCGASNRLSVYMLNTTLAPPNASPTIKETVGVYSYEGCRTEATATRALGAASTVTDGMTLEFCGGFCTQYTFFGVEYGRECYCGDSIAAGSVLVGDGDCSFPCAGDGGEFCGAGNRLGVYGKDS